MRKDTHPSVTDQTTTHINLIRHGETDWNLHRKYQGTSDIPLNDTGREQARLLGESMRGEQWDVIYSSPSIRAFDTAKAVADALGYPVDDIRTDKRFMERGYGDAEGLTAAEREAKWPKGNWPGLEQWEHAAERVTVAAREAVAANRGKRILIVCHGGIINALLAVLSDGEVGTGKNVIVNTSRTTITVNDGTWKIGAISDVAHLEPAPVAD